MFAHGHVNAGQVHFVVVVRFVMRRNGTAAPRDDGLGKPCILSGPHDRRVLLGVALRRMSEFLIWAVVHKLIG